MMRIPRSLSILVVLVSFAASPAPAQSLPSGWSSVDIGAVGATGHASYGSGVFTVAGAGADIWNDADAFRYVYTSLTGDGSIVTQVTSEEYVANWTKAGVMMRETLDPSSRQALMLVSPGKGLAFQRRVDPGGTSTNTSGGTGTAPYFVKLTRTGSTIAASISRDGTNWTLVGTDTIAMPATIYVGLAIGSHVYGSLATATFANTTIARASTTTTTETIVFFRHGEKPSGGYGQLTCQGLQRALALPSVLISRYGAAQAAFAPNPAVTVPDPAGTFYYVRPIATIEPTAIRLGLPLNTRYGYTEIAGLQAELTSGAYASSTVYVSWEHQYLQQVVQNIMNSYGSGVAVPGWVSGDYDSLFVVRITVSGGVASAQFTHEYEGLNNLSTSCQ
jgi:hypothetical protein